MFESLFRRKSIISWLREGPFGNHLEDLASSMLRLGYAADTIRVALRTGDQFARWLRRRGELADANESTGAAFIKAKGQPSKARRPKCAAVLHHVIAVLRQKGTVGQPSGPQPMTPAQQWLQRFENYRERVRGIVPATQQRYRSILEHFLSERFGTTEPDWSALTASDLTQFLQQQASIRCGYGRNVPAVALRAFLRFLTSQGVIRDGLERAVPTMRTWRHAALPPMLTDDQIEALLATCSEQHAGSLRDRAILLLLARLGMRAGEVATLSLDDVDWREGRLLVRSGKTHRERVLPLLPDVGNALAEYLRLGRHQSTSRKIFLGIQAPFRPFHGSTRVSQIVRMRLSQAGIATSTRYAAHLFRHTLASQLVCVGGSFKDVADILGHQSLQTTGIYAKLDLAALEKVALPVKGGAK